MKRGILKEVEHDKTAYKDTRLIPGTKRRVFIWLVSLVVFYLFSYLVDPLDPGWQDYENSPIQWIVSDILLSTVFCVLIAEVSLRIDGRLDRSLSWKGNPRSRLVIQIVFQVLGSAATSLLLYWLWDLLLYSEHCKNYTNSAITGYAQGIAISMAISITISAFNTVDYLLYNWKQTAIEATEHRLKSNEHQQAAMSAELQALKLQIDPHFIFNNLSVLSELILEDQQLGYEYAENFAKVYRYVLVHSKTDVVQLEEELKFLDSYIFLTDKRIGEGVRFNMTINSEDIKRNIPPLTLQFLVENAIKHNKTVKSQPLSINISSTGNGNLLVTNSLIPLVNAPVSSGIGLENIVSRYKLLSDRMPEIIKTPDSFTVKIPLLS